MLLDVRVCVLFGRRRCVLASFLLVYKKMLLLNRHDLLLQVDNVRALKIPANPSLEELEVVV